MPSSNATDEFKVYERAYLKLFQAVLGKKQGSAEEKKQIFEQLKSYLNKEVKDPESFIDHIPSFAGILKVPQPTLAGFIGQNALRAINLSRDEIRKENEEKGPAPGSAVFKDHDTGFIEQILKYAKPKMTAGGRFEALDGGYLKLTGPDGETFGTSLTGESADSGSEKTDGESGSSGSNAGISAAGSPSGREQKAEGSNQGSAAAGFLHEEKSVIQEILEEFGNVLNASEKLEPSPFPKDMPKDQEEQGQKVTGEPAETQQSWQEDETSVIEEILEKFGNVLNIPGKLEPSDGMEPESPFGGDEEDGDPDSDEYLESSEDDFEEIDMPFSKYAEIRQKLATFSKNKDTEGYNQYLASLDDEGKAVVGVRNVMTRLASGKLSDPDEHYRQIAAKLTVEYEAVRFLAGQMKAYDRMQDAMNRFIARAKTASPVVLKAVRSVWPQYRMVLDHLGHSAIDSELKLVLLAIVDPKVKAEVEKHIMNLTANLKDIYEQETSSL